MKHLKPINLAGRPGRRTLKTAPSLSCNAPSFEYGATNTPVISEVAAGIQAKKDKVAA